jgi:hypothetical protein
MRMKNYHVEQVFKWKTKREIGESRYAMFWTEQHSNEFTVKINFRTRADVDMQKQSLKKKHFIPTAAPAMANSHTGPLSEIATSEIVCLNSFKFFFSW